MQVPKDLTLLEKLPGVGHKTASVVVSQAFNIPAFPVDTHIHRLAQRWGLTGGKNVKQTEKDLKSIFNKGLWNKLQEINMSGDTKILDDLWGVIEERSSSLDKESYTRIMLEKDTNTLARKMGEESIETIVAALGQSKEDVINESADLLYHWLLLLKKLDINPNEVYQVLASRRKSSK